MQAGEVRDLEAGFEYSIVSDEAVVVSGRVRCWKCGAGVEVICLYCQTGLVLGRPLLHFSVSNVTALDERLRAQLARWPQFRLARRGPGAGNLYLNHCPDCGISQDDFFLHCQPEGVFFSFDDRRAAKLAVTALRGLVRLSGDEGFGP